MQDVNRLILFRLRFLKIRVRHGYILSGGEFKSLDYSVGRHFLAAIRADFLVLYPGTVLPAQLIKVDIIILCRCVKRYRYVNQTKRYRSFMGCCHFYHLELSMRSAGGLHSFFY